MWITYTASVTGLPPSSPYVIFFTFKIFVLFRQFISKITDCITYFPQRLTNIHCVCVCVCVCGSRNISKLFFLRIQVIIHVGCNYKTEYCSLSIQQRIQIINHEFCFSFACISRLTFILLSSLFLCTARYFCVNLRTLQFLHPPSVCCNVPLFTYKQHPLHLM